MQLSRSSNQIFKIRPIEEDFTFVKANAKEAEPALQFVPYKENEETKEAKEVAPAASIENSFGNMTAEKKLAKKKRLLKKRKRKNQRKSLFADDEEVDMF